MKSIIDEFKEYSIGNIMQMEAISFNSFLEIEKKSEPQKSKLLPEEFEHRSII